MTVCPQCASRNESSARFCGQCGRSLPEARAVSETDPWIGRTIDRRYRVLSLIGSGGMGLVYRVEHTQLGKIAAMKVLHADTARDADAVRRFRTEAQAVSRLSHPNIVQTFDFGQTDGALYLVMEYVRGEDLATLVKRDGPVPFHRAAPLFIQICSALTDAHDAGVIHRDLKPENIVVVLRRHGDAHAKVLDFGLAKLRERSDGAEITSRNQVIGTPYYMSPEQVRAEPLDLRTDIYSLGATLYRVLTGTPPFEATTPVGVLTMHITDPLEPPRERAPHMNLPAAADAIVARAMAKAREDRYGSAAEVQKDLEAALIALRHPGVADTGPVSAASAHEPLPRLTQNRVSTVALRSVPEPPNAVDPVSSDDSDADLDADAVVESKSRLRKQDFDEFERVLRRRKLVVSLVLPAFVVLASAIGVGIFIRLKERPSSVEREPNDSAAEATLLPLAAPVQGTVGSRQAGGQPDMDYFRIPLGQGGRVASARVEGIPGVDLVLELFDAQGTALEKGDGHGAGGGEWLQPITIGPGEAFVLVRQVWMQGTDLLEHVPTPYRLTVHWGPREPGWEMEPNDWRDHATAIETARIMRGYLGSADDIDWFSVTPSENGVLVGSVAAPHGVEIAVTVGDESPSTVPKNNKNDKGNQILKVPDIRIPARAGERTLIALTRVRAGEDDPKSDALTGLDAPYELKLELRRTP